ncbi:DNA-binding protein [Aeribacillus composti]|uniref:DNA-binding protein n=2 Tax=Bacillaceae TaxID=186817 RepID=UPI002E207B1F
MSKNSFKVFFLAMGIILESGEKMKQPTKEEIINKLKMILQGKLTLEEVADWASKYVMQDEPNISDETVWELLQIVSGIDLKDSPDEYLHVEQDIIDWINKYSN